MLEKENKMKITTPLGEVALLPTDGYHINAETMVLPGVTVSGINYHVHLHIYKYENGKRMEIKAP